MEKSIEIFDEYNEINKKELTLENIKKIEEQSDIIVNKIIKESSWLKRRPIMKKMLFSLIEAHDDSINEQLPLAIF